MHSQPRRSAVGGQVRPGLGLRPDWQSMLCAKGIAAPAFALGVLVVAANDSGKHCIAWCLPELVRTAAWEGSIAQQACLAKVLPDILACLHAGLASR